MLNLLIIGNSQLDIQKTKNIIDSFHDPNIKIIDLNEMQNSINILLNSSDTSNIKEYVNSLFKDDIFISDKMHIRNLCFSIIMCIIFLLKEKNQNLNIFSYNHELLCESLFNLETPEDVSNLIENLLIYINQYLLNNSNNKYSIIAERIIKFIEKDYLNNLSINSIADKFNYTPNYISYVFKQKFGQNISDYITELKISKAKELLLDTNNKIYDISKILGFSNTSYFCSVFKKQTSLTPKEYRSKNGL
nr:AraC family transcriptional regulator [Clostridium pasteurianum]